MSDAIIEKIADYLRKNDKQVSATELAERFLKMVGADPTVANKIVSALLAPHPQFVQDDKGNRRLNAPAVVQPDLSVVVCRVFPTSTQRSRIYAVFIAKFIDNEFVESRQFMLNYQPDRLREIANDLVHFVKNMPILFDGFGNQRSNFFWLLSQSSAVDASRSAFSLNTIAKKLYPDSAFSSPDDMAQVLLGAYQTGNADIQFDNLKEQVRTVVDMLKDKDINTVDDLQRFVAVEAQQPDYGKYAFGPDDVKNIPDRPGVYVMRNATGDVIYVGKAKILSRRLRSYFLSTTQVDDKLALIWDDLHDFNIIETGSELEALLLEYELIKKYQPPINTQFNVHKRRARSKERFERIFFLPAADQDQVKVLLYNPQIGIKLCEVAADAHNIDDLSVDITKLFGPPPEALADDQHAKIEIVTSWLTENSKGISAIDMRGVASVDEALRLIRQHVQHFDSAQRQVFY